MEAPLVRTPLYDWHVAHGARMVEFAGWAMPVQYTLDHRRASATRSAAGHHRHLAHGPAAVRGPGAAVFLAELLTRRVADMELGQIRYSLVTNDQGGILDDVLVGYYHNAYGQPFYVVVVNAGNRQKIVDWVLAHLPPERAEAPGEEVIFTDVTRLWAMFAIQGPRSVELLQPLVDVDLHSMRYYRGGQVQILHPAARAPGRHHQPHRLHGRRRLRAERRQRHRPGRLGGASSNWAGRWAGAHRAGRPRHAAAGGGHAALRPRAERADRSVRGRAGIRLPPGWATIFPAATPCCESSRSRWAASASAWNCRAGASPAKAAPSWPTAAGRRGHQRHLLADAPETDRHGLCPPGVCRAGHRAARRRRGHSEPARVVDLPFYRRNSKGARSDARTTALRQDARMGPRGSRPGRGEDRHRGALRLSPWRR